MLSYTKKARWRGNHGQCGLVALAAWDEEMAGGHLDFFRSAIATTNSSQTLQSHSLRSLHPFETPHTLPAAITMSAQQDNQMQGVQDPATEGKGKGKAPEDNTVEESMDDDSSDESGAEEQVRFPR